MCVCVVYTWRSEDNSRESVRLTHHVSSGDRTHVVSRLAASAGTRSATSEARTATFNWPFLLRTSEALGSPACLVRAGSGAAGEGGARPARPSRGPADAARRSVIREARRAPEGQVSSASGGRRGGATPGSPDLWAARETKAARGRESRRRAEGDAGEGRRPLRHPRGAQASRTPRPRHPREAALGAAEAGPRARGRLPGPPRARAHHPRGQWRPYLSPPPPPPLRPSLRVSPPRAPLSPPSRPPLRPHARSLAQPRAGHRRRRLAAPASRLVRRAAPAVVPPPPAAGPASHRAAGLSIRPQKARGLPLRRS